MRVHPRDEADLLWYFNDAMAQLDARGSLHAALEYRLQFAAIRRETLFDSEGRLVQRVHVGSSKPAGRHPEHPDEDSPALRAAFAERRIRRQLDSAGPWAFKVLRLRYREVLPECRVPFGLEGASSERPPPRRQKLTLIAVRQTLARGCGSLAHLTDAAQVAYAAARTTRELAGWVDALGRKLASGSASAAERDLQGEIRRQAERQVVDAWHRYQRGPGRVPELVRRRAAARAA